MNDPTDWNAVALTRLTNVLGPVKGPLAMQNALAAIGLPALRTADDLHRLAQHLLTLGGFEAAIGSLLSLHAVLHSPRSTPDR